MLSKIDYHANITNDKQCSVRGCELVRECVCVLKRKTELIFNRPEHWHFHFICEQL